MKKSTIILGLVGLLALPSCVVTDPYGFGGPGFTSSNFVVGSTLNTLPVGYQSVFWNNNPYFVHGNNFFVRRGGNFVCVNRPVGPIFLRNGRRFHNHRIHHRGRAVNQVNRGRAINQFNRGRRLRPDIDRSRGPGRIYRSSNNANNRNLVGRSNNRGSNFVRTVSAPGRSLNQSQTSSRNRAVNSPRNDARRTRGAPSPPQRVNRSRNNGRSSAQSGSSRSSRSSYNRSRSASGYDGGRGGNRGNRGGNRGGNGRGGGRR